MKEKLIWKIESLWDKYYSSIKDNDAFFDTTITDLIIDEFFNEKKGSNRVGNFCLVEKFSFNKTNEPVFSDSLGNYYGLENNEVLIFDKKLIYLFDNHNKFLVPLFHLYQTLERPLRVLHIDAHNDDALYEHNRPVDFNEDTLVELMQKTRISDFYDSLLNTNTISEIVRITHSEEFEEIPEGEYDIASLDIDIFGPEGDFTDIEKKIAVIASAFKQSKLITIATSPGFIDQDFAHTIIETFLRASKNRN